MSPVRAGAIAGLILLLGGCASPSVDSLAPRTAGHIDLKRYQGKWFELAHLPLNLEQGCAQSETHYNVRADGSLGVLNRCRTLDDRWSGTQGSAWRQAPERPDRFWIAFDKGLAHLMPSLARREYWVLYVDERYQQAIVGSPDRRSLWILSRTPVLAVVERERLLAKARQQGYDTTRLVWRVADRDIALLD